MPRRPSKLRRQGGSKKTKLLNREDGKIKKWNTLSDIPLGEEDQFHESRDRILLEGDNNALYEDSEDEDEVFALNGMEDSASEEEGFQESVDEGQQEASIPSKEKKKKRKKKKLVEEREEEEEGEEESWGKGRAAFYSSNADQLDTDDEEGNELEEQESKRLQAKMRAEMKDDDFGLNDNPNREKVHEVEPTFGEVDSLAPTLADDKKTLLRYLEQTSPEALALARDWDETALNLVKTQQRIAKLEKENSDALSLGMIHLHYQALLSYSTTLAFYLHMRSSPKYARRPALLQSHPILQRLLTLKQSLQTLEDLDFALSDSEDDGDDFSSNMDTDEIMADSAILWDRDNSEDLEDLDSNELEDLLADAKMSMKQSEEVYKPLRKKRKTVELHDDPVPKPVKPVFDLIEPEYKADKSTKFSSFSRRHGPEDTVDAFGEAMTLHSVDAADKTARKKSLRFHTSKIESASARRHGARNQTVGGDDDIPYRERKKEKDARLVKEAAIKAQNEIGVPLDDEEPQAGDKRPREDDGGESPDEYYELVKKRIKEDKLKKKAEYEETRLDRVPLEEGSGSGPRSLTRAILKNKGLTPRRPKSVRNPRVKKRLRYEKAQKKIASQKAIYKGGLSETGGKYGGEKSGISKVVKSVRLG